MDNIMEATRVSFSYSQEPESHLGLDGISLGVHRGGFLAVLGHNGSGKSTLIQHLNGLLAPTSGKVYIGEQDLWADKSKLRSFRFAVGLVFQYPEYQLFGETVYSDIAFGPTNMGLPPDEVDARVRQAARFVGLSDDKLQKSPFELSGGQKRRVAIAGVLAMDPKVLILDEPINGLDPIQGAGQDTGGDTGVPPGEEEHRPAGEPQHGGHR